MPQSLIAQLTQVDRRTRALQCTAVLALVLVVGVVIGVTTLGYAADIEQGKTWARHLVRNGVRDAYRALFFGAGEFRDRVDKVAAEFGDNVQVAKIIAFIRAGKRPFTMAVKRSETDGDL